MDGHTIEVGSIELIEHYGYTTAGGIVFKEDCGFVRATCIEVAKLVVEYNGIRGRTFKADSVRPSTE